MIGVLCVPEGRREKEFVIPRAMLKSIKSPISFRHIFSLSLSSADYLQLQSSLHNLTREVFGLLEDRKTSFTTFTLSSFFFPSRDLPLLLAPSSEEWSPIRPGTQPPPQHFI